MFAIITYHQPPEFFTSSAVPHHIQANLPANWHDPEKSMALQFHPAVLSLLLTEQRPSNLEIVLMIGEQTEFQ